jgi:hypothetical protein
MLFEGNSCPKAFTAENAEGRQDILVSLSALGGLGGERLVTMTEC